MLLHPVLKGNYNKDLIQPLIDPDYLLASVINPVSAPAQIDPQKEPRPVFLYLTSFYLPLTVPDIPAVPADDTIIHLPTMSNAPPDTLPTYLCNYVFNQGRRRWVGRVSNCLPRFWQIS